MNSTPNNASDSMAPQAPKARSLPLAFFWAGVSLALGLAGGGFLHYLIYRLSLPTEPFIYVSF